MALNADIVPFGKYKGRPVEDMLADVGYMRWLEAQPWFREKFAMLARKQKEELERTPDHNKLQALFLDEKYQKAFVKIIHPTAFDENLNGFRGSLNESIENLNNIMKNNKIELSVEEYEYKVKTLTHTINECARIIKIYTDMTFFVNTKVKFEHNGCDVYINVSSNSVTVFEKDYFTIKYNWHLYHDLLIEIKPVISDDYPVILRQMNKNKSKYLFVDKYQGEGATKEQFVQIFSASDKIVVFKSDVDNVLKSI